MFIGVAFLLWKKVRFKKILKNEKNRDISKTTYLRTSKRLRQLLIRSSLRTLHSNLPTQRSNLPTRSSLHILQLRVTLRSLATRHQHQESILLHLLEVSTHHSSSTGRVLSPRLLRRLETLLVQFWVRVLAHLKSNHCCRLNSVFFFFFLYISINDCFPHIQSCFIFSHRIPTCLTSGVEQHSLLVSDYSLIISLSQKNHYQ